VAINLIPAFALLAFCVVIHATGLMFLLRWMLRRKPKGRWTLWRDIWFLVRVSWIIVALHTLEIILFSLYYVHEGCLDDLHTAFYFSAVTYTTVGYGDILLPEEWRGLAGAEALTGILMTGLSTGFFFMILGKMFLSPEEVKER
jgi:hypothetical protein